jgi:hypothetical protein
MSGIVGLQSRHALAMALTQILLFLLALKPFAPGLVRLRLSFARFSQLPVRRRRLERIACRLGLGRSRGLKDRGASRLSDNAIRYAALEPLCEIGRRRGVGGRPDAAAVSGIDAARGKPIYDYGYEQDQERDSRDDGQAVEAADRWMLIAAERSW